MKAQWSNASPDSSLASGWSWNALCSSSLQVSAASGAPRRRGLWQGHDHRTALVGSHLTSIPCPSTSHHHSPRHLYLGRELIVFAKTWPEEHRTATPQPGERRGRSPGSHSLVRVVTFQCRLLTEESAPVVCGNSARDCLNHVLISIVIFGDISN